MWRCWSIASGSYCPIPIPTTSSGCGRGPRDSRRSVVPLRLPATDGDLQAERLDTIICPNKTSTYRTELSLATMFQLLQPGGRLVLLVPSLPAIYGTLDRAPATSAATRRPACGASMPRRFRAASILQPGWRAGVVVRGGAGAR
jgi:hypothetical protein